jgi:hypothetical protein
MALATAESLVWFKADLSSTILSVINLTSSLICSKRS